MRQLYLSPMRVEQCGPSLSPQGAIGAHRTMAGLRRQMSRIGGDFAEVAAIADHRWPQAASGDRLLPGESGAVTCKGKQRGLALEMVAIDLFESHAMADLLLTTRQAVLCYASCAYAVSLFSGAQGDRK